MNRLTPTLCGLIVLWAGEIDAQSHLTATRGLAQIALADTGLIRHAISLDNWRKTHSRGVVTFSDTTPEQLADNHWCATALDSVGPVTQRVTRTAFFYVPKPPAHLILPQPSAHLSEQCQLGMLQLTAHVADSVTARTNWQSDSGRISTLLDVPPRLAEFVEWPADRHGGRQYVWRGRDVIVASTVAAERATASPSAVFNLVIAHRTYTPVLDGDYVIDSLGREEKIPGKRSPLLDTLVKLGGLNEVQTSEAIHYADLFAIGKGGNGPLDTLFSGQFTSLLDRLVAGSSAMATDQRVARLLAAQLLLGASGPTGWGGDTSAAPIRQQFARAGAHLEDNHMAGGWIARDNWLWDAFDLRSSGPAAQRAYLWGLLNGLNRSADGEMGCDTDDLFRRVIASGPEWLAAHPHSPYVADVELAIAEAYTDIVTLAGGGTYGGQIEDGAKYLPEVPAAKRRAIEYYRKAFALKPGLPRARSDWEDAWRLVTGLAPTHARFYCIND